MRKVVFAILAMIFLAKAAHAAPGDTTWVNANNVLLNYYNNFDTAVKFPDGTKTYRKIYMIFTLGKYACSGSGYCGDWDYTVQTYLMGKSHPDTLELGRFITPYAHTGYYRFSATWTNRYIFDVTDYYPALRDSATIRIHYSGYSGGFTGNVKFAFIEGTPERNVLRVDRIWHGDFNYGHGSTPINTALKQLSKTAPANTQTAELKMNITGHGGDDSACAEFCPNVYSIDFNGGNIVQQKFYRQDCSMNDLYAQTGTWVLARANWCPGALVYTISHTLPAAATTPTAPYTLKMSFPAYTSTTNMANTSPASYTIDGAVVYYGSTNKTLDASLEDIIAPTKAEYHWRDNPTATNPILSVRNTGATPITSIKFSYGVTGQPAQTYTWAGTLPSLATSQISLPSLRQLQLPSGSYNFIAKIVQVNGSADSDPLNDSLGSTFAAAPAWPSDLEIAFTTNEEPLPGSATVSQTAWRIEDSAGNTVVQCNKCGLRTLCDTTFHLANGPYRFVVSDSNFYDYYDIAHTGSGSQFTGTGLSGFSTYSGSIRIYDANIGGGVSLPGYMSGNFGGGFTQQFYVNDALAVPAISAPAASLKAMPNPSSNFLTVVVDGLAKSEGELRIIDLTGRVQLSAPYSHGYTRLDVSAMPAGIYVLSYLGDNGMRLQQPIVVAH